MKNTPQSKYLLSAISLATFTLMANAQAQDTNNLNKVEITGSLIKRLDTEAALPVTTIKAEEFAARGITTIADVMMTLPQSFKCGRRLQHQFTRPWGESHPGPGQWQKAGQ